MSLPGPHLAPDPIRYLDDAAASAPGREYKQRLLAQLALRPGQAVLDVGCGPGTDLPGLAEAVTTTGSVIGVDHDPAMVAEARRRLGSYDQVEVREGDAHALPVADATVDRARADRLLQHLADPAAAVRELARVLCGGGIVGLAEPDWYTLAVDDEDLGTSHAFTRFVAGKVRNGAIGRQLVRLMTGAGLTAAAVNAAPIVFRDFAAAEQILGLRRNAARAVAAGTISDERAGQWLDRLSHGSFFATFTFFTATGVAPPK